MFVHAPLEKPSDIRLVEVQPGEGHDVSVTLRVRAGASAGEVEYSALSYTWGDSEEVVEIKVDGEGFAVTRNLHAALLRYREDLGRQEAAGDEDATMASLLWVDALSINLSDPEERSAQVARMSAIYSGAASVFAWLGPEAENSPLAFAKIRTAMSRYYALTGPQPPMAVPRWAAAMIADELMLCEDDEDDATIWVAVQALFGREWWSRIWVAQEASTRSPTWIVCGSEKMLLDEILTFTVIMGINEQDDEDAASRVYPISPYVYSLEDLRSQRYAEGPERELLNMLMSCRHYDATDPRDKVYGVLGMVAPRGTSRLLPDYRKELVDVFTDVVQYQLETSSYEGKLDFLGGDGLPEGGMTGLPSWLPDWRFRHQYHVPFRKFFENAASTPRPGEKREGPCVFNASGTADQIKGLNIDLSSMVQIEGRSLKVKGYRVGYLYDIKPVFEPSSQDAIETWKTGIRPARYFTGESEHEAFNRLIVAGLIHDGTDAVARTPIEPPQPDEQDDGPPVENVLVACSGRRFARVVQKDWNADGIALVPQCVREGDQVFVLFGGQVLYVLRPVGTGYKFLGECYVHGLMDGEVLDILGTGLAKVRDIVIR